MENNQTYWKKCSACKKEIPFNTPYQLCSVSTCRSKKTGLVFCSVACWDSHLGFANHRSAYAEEHISPNKETYEQEILNTNQQPTPKRKIVSPSSSISSAPIKVDTLVVVSKVKAFIKEQSGFNTSQCAIDELTQIVVRECQRAMENAQTSDRKTVMGRDF